jgi:hypothetical protein
MQFYFVASIYFHHNKSVHRGFFFHRQRLEIFESFGTEITTCYIASERIKGDKYVASFTTLAEHLEIEAVRSVLDLSKYFVRKYGSFQLR